MDDQPSPSPQINLALQMAGSARNPDLLRAGQALVTNDLPAAEALLRPHVRPSHLPQILALPARARGDEE